MQSAGLELIGDNARLSDGRGNLLSGLFGTNPRPVRGGSVRAFREGNFGDFRIDDPEGLYFSLIPASMTSKRFRYRYGIGA
jgi:hypothetical protein